MKTYHVGYDRVARIAHVGSDAQTLPSGVMSLGSFKLIEDIEFDFGAETFIGSATIFDGVRDRFAFAGEHLSASVEIMLA